LSGPIEEVLGEQRRYYRARAGEYEDWWFRRGRYDHGPEANERWFGEAREVQDTVERFLPTGRVLELACGTGLWTARLAPLADRLTALDSSPEVLALARGKVLAPNVTWVQADVFEWEPDQSYDVCFFGFWLSHVPRELLASFWEKVGRALSPQGRVYLVDSARSERASARDHSQAAPGTELERRRLQDGSEYRVVKHWFEAATLQQAIEQQGWEARIEATEEFFVHGWATPPGWTQPSRGSRSAPDGA
jgi:SAM-dependent methyltransferase